MHTSHLFVTSVIAAGLIVGVGAQTQKAHDPIIGAWTLNKNASELGVAGEGRDGGEDGRRGDGSGRRRGGGGFGNQTPQNQETQQRMRDALRQEMQAPDHMTIVASDTTIIITTPDGHTTRLSTDGKKIKDDSTGIERKSKWDAGRLVSEINGLGRGKITETYSIEGDPKQLRVKLEVDGPRKTTQTRVYDLDAK